jgi:valyl-tRNA synthetase
VVATTDEAPSEDVVTTVLAVGQVALPMAGLFDPEVERARLEKQISEAGKHVASLTGKLSNEQFTSRAPAEVVERERASLEIAQARLEGLRHSVTELG